MTANGKATAALIFWLLALGYIGLYIYCAAIGFFSLGRDGGLRDRRGGARGPVHHPDGVGGADDPKRDAPGHEAIMKGVHRQRELRGSRVPERRRSRRAVRRRDRRASGSPRPARRSDPRLWRPASPPRRGRRAADGRAASPAAADLTRLDPAAERASISPSPLRAPISRQRSQPSTAGASSRTMRWTSGSSTASRNSSAPASSPPAGCPRGQPIPPAGLGQLRLDLLVDRLQQLALPSKW